MQRHLKRNKNQDNIRFKTRITHFLSNLDKKIQIQTEK